MASWAALRTFGKELRLADDYGPMVGDEVLTVFTPAGAPRRAREGSVPYNTLAGHSTLAASSQIPSYKSAADVVITAGYQTYADAGGLPWKRVGSTPSTLTYFRKQDFHGNWYEAVTKNEIYGEQLGIFGDSATDVGGVINEVIAWLGDKGGGRLILPPGVVHSAIDLVCDRDGIWVSGTIVGNNVTNDGTILRLGHDKTFFVGGNVATGGGVARNVVKFSDFTCLQQALPADNEPSSTYYFSSRAIRRLQFRDLHMRGIHGFHRAGDTLESDTAPGTFPNVTRQVSYENIEGNHGLISESFLLGLNLGSFYMDNVVMEGAVNVATILDNTAFIEIPASAKTRPDGVIVANCGARRFDRGIDVRYGIANMLVSNSWFDEMKRNGMLLHSNTTIQGVRVSNCHFEGDSAPTNAQIGISLVRSENPLRRVEVTDSQIMRFGRNAVRIGNDSTVEGAGAEHLSIVDNQMEDNCSATDNVESAVFIDPNADNVKVSDNQIYKVTFSEPFVNRPRYGIDVGTVFNKSVSVTDNTILDISTLSGAKTINNPTRGTLKIRKISGNTDQVFEGQLVVIGPWIEQNVMAGIGDAPMFLAAASAPQTFLHRRAQLVGIFARANSAVTGGTIRFTATVDTVAQSLTCTAGAGEASGQFCSSETLQGIQLGAGQSVGIDYRTTTISPSGSTDWAVYLAIVYD